MSDTPDTAKVRFIDLNGPITLTNIAKPVQPGEEVEVPTDVAERLLCVPSAWAPVDKAAKNIVAAIEKEAAKADQADDTTKPEEA